MLQGPLALALETEKFEILQHVKDAFAVWAAQFHRVSLQWGDGENTKNTDHFSLSRQMENNEPSWPAELLWKHMIDFKTDGIKTEESRCEEVRWRGGGQGLGKV